MSFSPEKNYINDYDSEGDTPRQPVTYAETCRYLTSLKAMAAVATRGTALFEGFIPKQVSIKPQKDTMHRRWLSRSGNFQGLRPIDGELHKTYVCVHDSNIAVRSLKHLFGKQKTAIADITTADTPYLSL